MASTNGIQPQSASTTTNCIRDLDTNGTLEHDGTKTPDASKRMFASELGLTITHRSENNEVATSNPVSFISPAPDTQESQAPAGKPASRVMKTSGSFKRSLDHLEPTWNDVSEGAASLDHQWRHYVGVLYCQSQASVLTRDQAGANLISAVAFSVSGADHTNGYSKEFPKDMVRFYGVNCKPLWHLPTAHRLALTDKNGLWSRAKRSSKLGLSGYVTLHPTQKESPVLFLLHDESSESNKALQASRPGKIHRSSSMLTSGGSSGKKGADGSGWKLGQGILDVQTPELLETRSHAGFIHVKSSLGAPRKSKLFSWHSSGERLAVSHLAHYSRKPHALESLWLKLFTRGPAQVVPLDSDDPEPDDPNPVKFRLDDQQHINSVNGADAQPGSVAGPALTDAGSDTRISPAAAKQRNSADEAVALDAVNVSRPHPSAMEPDIRLAQTTGDLREVVQDSRSTEDTAAPVAAEPNNPSDDVHRHQDGMSRATDAVTISATSSSHEAHEHSDRNTKSDATADDGPLTAPRVWSASVDNALCSSQSRSNEFDVLDHPSRNGAIRGGPSARATMRSSSMPSNIARRLEDMMQEADAANSLEEKGRVLKKMRSRVSFMDPSSGERAKNNIEQLDSSRFGAQSEAASEKSLIGSMKGDEEGPGAEAAEKQVQIVPYEMRELLEVGFSTFSSVAGTWKHINPFAVDALTRGHGLSVMGLTLLQRDRRVLALGIDLRKLTTFLLYVERLYTDAPYHNSRHALHVLWAVHCLLHLTKMAYMLSPVEIMAVYTTAICHDMGHRGTNSAYLLNNRSRVSLLFGKISPLERCHVGLMLLLTSLEETDFMHALSPTDRRKFDSTVAWLVMGTDMALHDVIMNEFKERQAEVLEMAEQAATRSGKINTGAPARPKTTHGPSLTTQPTMRDNTRRSSNVPASPDSFQPSQLSTAELVCMVLIKCADLSHAAAELPIHIAWVARLEEEFYRQGDLERGLGWMVPPVFDRTVPGSGLTSTQVGFFKGAVLPMYRDFAAAFPHTKQVLECAENNFRYWETASQSLPRAASVRPQ